MTNTLKIAWKFINARNSSGLISFSFYLSVIGLAIGTASLLLISFFSNGFDSKVKSKLAMIDGELRLEKYNNDNRLNFTQKDYEEILLRIKNIKDIKSISKYSQIHAMLQSGQHTEGTLIYGIDFKLLNELSTESKLLINGEFQGNNLIMGEELCKNLGLQIGDKITLFDLDALTNHQNIKGLNLNLIGTISTGFFEYDKLISFIPEETFQSFYNSEKLFSGLVVNSISGNNEQLSKSFNEILTFPYIIKTWQERHGLLLEWMNVYNIPIQMVMWFITLLSIFNVSSTIWMTSLDKTKNIAILKIIGFRNSQIRNIFIFKGIIIGFLGIFSGVTFSSLIYYLQSNYHVIKLSSEIYFLEYLPVKINYNQIFFILIFILSTVTLFSFIPANIIKKTNPPETLKEN